MLILQLELVERIQLARLEAHGIWLQLRGKILTTPVSSQLLQRVEDRHNLKASTSHPWSAIDFSPFCAGCPIVGEPGS
jgi:hypothetical protein